jgi:cyclic beta-1,2-glucan synthetase
MFHLMAVYGAEIGEISYETDRMQFIGRGRTVADPQAMCSPAALSGREGSVLDPIVAIRYRLALDPGESVTVNIVSGVGESREGCWGLVEKYQDRRLADRVFDLAWTHNQVALRQINASEADAQLYCRLARSVIYANASLRADPSVLIKNRRGQSGLWGYSISGDLPIVLLQIEDPANIDLVRQLIQAHAYWRLKGLAVDLMVWNEDLAGYRQLLHDQIMDLIAAGVEASEIDRPGGIFVRPADQISEEDSYYDLPNRSQEAASLYDHCVRAILRGLRFGEHGLPFMGSGDWNDGMNLVGEHGKGESVWLGFFLFAA